MMFNANIASSSHRDRLATYCDSLKAAPIRITIETQRNAYLADCALSLEAVTTDWKRWRSRNPAPPLSYLIDAFTHRAHLSLHPSIKQCSLLLTICVRRSEPVLQILMTPGCGNTRKRLRRKLPTKPIRAATILLKTGATPAPTNPTVAP